MTGEYPHFMTLELKTAFDAFSRQIPTSITRIRMKYTFYIDESGDAGIGKIRTDNTPGSSPYMTMGGALIPEVKKDEIRQALVNLKAIIKKELHCSELNHIQKIKFAKEASEQQILLFGLISRKETLKEYKSTIDGDNKKFYNKCASYLIEYLCAFLKEKKISRNDVDIVFEEGNFDYNALKNYIKRCRKTPLYTPTKILTHIDANNISAQPKQNEILLAIPDLVAHALFKCVDKTAGNHFITEYRYLKEISRKFHHSVITNKIVGSGIKPIHKLESLILDKDTFDFFKDLKAR
ncbi:DUF3800 domain-containing protein [Roseibium polysiphoniae]|uniref:DUF3800 domain-containing protein n=1 Tax=Roseibium polysiphoniae TaxID=2571221 RepID=A0ABR9CAK8_9HYPH|nr:DUF3800 domain-containing protein [Roseibium polysiphoniae]MBD8876942.1 DUF3800 domain-containing protein [Roseibium polysiphoniae]